LKLLFQQTLVVLTIAVSATFSWAQQEATRSDGTKIALFSNGTWEYASEIHLPENAMVLDSPSFTGNTLAIEEAYPTEIKLKRISAQKRGYDELEGWLRTNDLPPIGIQDIPRYLKKRGKLPKGTPLNYKGEPLLRFYGDSLYRALVYGNYQNNGSYLVVTNSSYDSVYHCWDFRNYEYAPLSDTGELYFTKQGPQWVKIVGNQLLVSFYHRTYAQSSGGQNGYLRCYDIQTGNILWETEPLHCNSNNFVVHNDIIFCGYGFTKEDDYLILLNRKTGQLVDRYKVKTQVEYVAVKEDKVYVRAYWSDYIYEIR
jgi:WD40 repeat protein